LIRVVTESKILDLRLRSWVMGDLLSVIHYPHNHVNVGKRLLPRSGLLEQP
jgi:hypothetical protein